MEQGYPDIVNFLINSTSAYTLEQLKCYKGLDAYNQFMNGWVRDVAVYRTNDLCLHTARVMHSQRLSETPLAPWVIIQPDGKVMAAHCNCMAGLGESCTHVAALLFSIEATVKIRDSRTVTEEKAYWLPASVKGVSYSALKEINFTSAKTKKKTMDSCLSGTPVTPRGVSDLRVVEPPTESELSGFLHNLSLTGARSARLSVKQPFQKEFVPAPLSANFPTILTDFYSKELLAANFSEILKHCEKCRIEVTQQQADSVEGATKQQSKSKLWHRFRSGRVTAPKIYSACHSKPAAPSLSLVMSICYRAESSFKSAATTWGCEHEKAARVTYQQSMEMLHDNFTMEDAGFCINPQFPALGASPDGFVSCDCCGVGACGG